MSFSEEVEDYLKDKLKRGQPTDYISRTIDRMARTYYVDEFTQKLRQLFLDGYADEYHSHD